MSGQPVELVVRIRPSLETEQRTGEVQVGADKQHVTLVPREQPQRPPETHKVQRVFAAGAALDLYEHSLSTMLLRLLEGYSVNVVAIGGEHAGKTSMMEGRPGAGHEGIMALMARGLFDSLTDKARLYQRREAAFATEVGLQYVEIVDEHITDLLSSANAELDPQAEMLGCGGMFRGLNLRGKNEFFNMRPVHNAEEAMRLLGQGHSRRNKLSTAVGSASSRASAVVCFELTQVYGEGVSSIVHRSRLNLFDTPAIDKLKEDPSVLQLREGPLTNRSVLSLGKMLQQLHDHQRRQANLMAGNPHSEAEAWDYSESVLSSLLADAFGGNGYTLVIAALRAGNLPQNSLTLGLVSSITGIRTYPVVNTHRFDVLISRYQRKIGRLRKLIEELKHKSTRLQANEPRAAATEGYQQLEYAFRRLNELEQRHAADDAEQRRLNSEKEQLRRVYSKEHHKTNERYVGELHSLREALQDLRTNYSTLLNEKATVQQMLVRSEEERLSLEQKLVALEIEQTKSSEQAESKQYELVNKLIGYENDLLELHAHLNAVKQKLPTAEKDVKAARSELDKCREEKEKLEKEHADLIAEYQSVRLNFVETKKISEEVKAELLSMVSQTRLPKSPAKDDEERLSAQNQRLMDENERLRQIIDERTPDDSLQKRIAELEEQLRVGASMTVYPPVARQGVNDVEIKPAGASPVKRSQPTEVVNVDIELRRTRRRLVLLCRFDPKLLLSS
jgi:hypothetical protein